MKTTTFRQTAVEIYPHQKAWSRKRFMKWWKRSDNSPRLYVIRCWFGNPKARNPCYLTVASPNNVFNAERYNKQKAFEIERLFERTAPGGGAWSKWEAVRVSFRVRSEDQNKPAAF